MIYNQAPLFYFLSIVITAILALRLNKYLKDFFPNSFSIVVALAILFHPLSIDAFLGPNFISGPLAFFLFLEALFFIKKENILGAIFLIMGAAACNLAYCLVPIYIFLKYKKQLQQYLIPAVFYSLLLSIYLWKHLFLTPHNPIVFFSYFIMNLLAPLSLNIIDYSLFPFFASATILTVSVLLVIRWRQSFNSCSKQFWPMLFLPIIGSGFHQWSTPYRFWNNVLFSPSNFLCITFSFIVMLAIHLPRKIFIFYFAFILFFSVNWAFQWHPNSNLLEYSLNSLPSNYSELTTVKRVLAWEYLHEKNHKNGFELLRVISIENPELESLKKDLEVLDKNHH